MTITSEAIEAFALAFWPVNAVSKMESCRDDIAKALEAALPFLPIAGEGKAEPRAWFVKDFADGWIHFDNEADAKRQIEATGAIWYVAHHPALVSSPGKDGGQEVEALDAYNRSKGDTHCQTCDGTGNEGLHSICRDCDESVGAHPEMEAVAYRYRCTDIDGNPIGGWLYSDDAGSLGLREPLYTRPQPASTALVERAAAFDQIVAARKAYVDAVAAYNARLELARAERERGNWQIKLDREYDAMSEAQSAWHRTVQELADAALQEPRQ